jgi:hypothetical protein
MEVKGLFNVARKGLEEHSGTHQLLGCILCTRIRKIYEDGYTVKEIDVAKAGGKK